MSAPHRAGRVITTRVGTAHVREDGAPEAPPLVLLHGFAGSLHWFDRLVPLLAEHHRVIRIDLLGHAGTGGRSADAPRQGRMVAAVLEHLHVSETTMVGHSFGADVALAAAERCERVAELALIAQAPELTGARLPPASALMTVPIVGPMLHRLAPARLIRRLGALAVAPGHRLGQQLVRDQRAMDPGTYRTILRDRRHRLTRDPLDHQLRQLALPVMVVLGRHDRFFGAGSASRYTQAGAQVELTDSGHSPMIETPMRLAGLLRRFLRDTKP